MGQILRNWRIPTALAFSVLLIVGSYLLAHGVGASPVAEASAETALLQAIASKDSDNDGLPDWEEALYGTNPNVVDTFNLGMTDGEAVAKGLIVPKAIANITTATSSATTQSTIDFASKGLTPPTEGTLTDTFAKNFFALYLNAKQANGGADLSPADTNSVASQALDSLSSSITTASDFKSAADLIVAGTGSDALRAFAVDAETLLHKNTSTATTSELLYLEQAIANNDASALTQLTSIAKIYRDSAAGLAALSVPQELAASDLALINSLMRMSEIITDFSRVNVDALTAMLALQQYVSAAQSLRNALTDISNVYTAAGISLPSGTPGAAFVNVVANTGVPRTQP